MTLAIFMMETRDCHAFQTEERQTQRRRSVGSPWGALDRALEHSDLMAQLKDLRLKRGSSPK
jgi:hypothetical protein